VRTLDRAPTGGKRAGPHYVYFIFEA
jgi:hypothetical protein